MISTRRLAHHAVRRTISPATAIHGRSRQRRGSVKWVHEVSNPTPLASKYSKLQLEVQQSRSGPSRSIESSGILIRNILQNQTSQSFNSFSREPHSRSEPQLPVVDASPSVSRRRFCCYSISCISYAANHPKRLALTLTLIFFPSTSPTNKILTHDKKPATTGTAANALYFAPFKSTSMR